MKGKKNIWIYVVMALVSVSWMPKAGVQWNSINKESMAAVLKAMNSRFMNTRCYKVTITDESYADYNTTQFYQKSAGYFIKNGDTYHNYNLGVHTIQNKHMRISIDSIKKIIMIADPTDYFEKQYTMSDYSLLLKVCTSISMADLGKESMYRMEFVQGYPISTYEITVKDSLPEKMVLYYGKAVKGINEKELAKPRLEITFNQWMITSSNIKDNYTPEKYIDKKGNNYVLTPPYASTYKLLDERVLTRTNKK